VIVDSFKFLPRTFRPLYEGRGPYPGEEAPVWAPFQKCLAESRIALLTSAGIYLEHSQPSFDLDREQTHPEWGDPTWRSIPAGAKAEDLGVAHPHINDEDVLAGPEIALPMHLLGDLATERLIGGAAVEHVAEWPVSVREAYRAWQPKEPSPIVRKLLEDRKAGA